jgi:hypothetical protein
VATNDRPLIMILDGLDQLGSAHRAYSLAWLPIVLPSNVRLVVSVLRHTTHELFETLEALLPYRFGASELLSFLARLRLFE